MSKRRQQSFEAIEADNAFDVIVVGGGINGIGVFRELALQNLRVLLVERNDFASGCSAAPSRMIHGGLRYLENGEFALVQESLRERDALLANAPHMVRPLPTTVPITATFSGLLNGAASFLGFSTPPARRGSVALKVGLSLYDWITRKNRVLPPHRFRTASETFRMWPRLTPRLRGSATYFDAWISHPERLALELVLDVAAHAPNSIALNYVELVRDGDGYALADNIGGRRYPVKAGALVNATGAWLDEAVASLGGHSRPAGRYVSGTKGSHIVLDHPQMHAALNGHMIFFENDDGRVCIVFPYLGKVLAGSTDIRVERAERVHCTDEERDYILGALKGIFPDVEITSGHIVYSYSGIRPLLHSDQAFTGRISRGHMVRRIDGPVPQFCMIGGKWTTFRAFAEQTADDVLAFLNKPRTCDTRQMPIGGGADYPTGANALTAKVMAEHGISAARAAWLADLYGTRAKDVLSFCKERSDDLPVAADIELTRAEIAYLAHNEHIVTLGDLVLRRLPLAITGRICNRLINVLAETLSEELAWSPAQEASEVGSLKHDLHTYHGVTADMLAQRN